MESREIKKTKEEGMDSTIIVRDVLIKSIWEINPFRLLRDNVDLRGI